jgi:hypothetical protein
MRRAAVLRLALCGALLLLAARCDDTSPSQPQTQQRVAAPLDAEALAALAARLADAAHDVEAALAAARTNASAHAAPHSTAPKLEYLADALSARFCVRLRCCAKAPT